MNKKLFLLLICTILCINASYAEIKNPFKNPFNKTPDERSKELKYKYDVLKDDEKNKMEKTILDRTPSGYMTVAEYEGISEYKEKSELEFDIPKIEKPSDFKYIPKPLYRITPYNDPPGSAELTLGKKLFKNRQINGQGIVSPDYSLMVYPAIYYYADSASVASDLFMIPLDEDDTNLNRILKANVAKRYPDPILSTDKKIDNFAAFRTLTPVDFSADGTKLLVKEKIGSSEDGIWQTRIYVYDFNKMTSYDLVELRDAITYYWKEYKKVNLDNVRWDIIPLGFSEQTPTRVVVQAYAYTGETPVYLGSWSIDCWGNQSRLISLDKNSTPKVSINGYKLIQDGVQSYRASETEEKIQQDETKYLEKQKKAQEKEAVKSIKEDYKYAIRALDDEYKDEYRDYMKLRSLTGATENTELEAAYEQYLKDQLNKDIQKTEKQIDKHKKDLDKINSKIEKLNEQLRGIYNPPTQSQEQENPEPAE